MLKDKHILLGISGGIAAYKIADLASRLKKRGAIIKTVMTENACEFITPTTIAAITNETVSVKHFPTQEIEHIRLADWADIFVVAPATANIIGKIASGIADDLLTTTILATTAPKLIIPAMNVNMYETKILQYNLKKLKDFGFYILPPDTGKLACGYTGKGRLPDPKEILYFIDSVTNYTTDYKNKKILITAGATIEEIDPMRFISNYSTGKTGLALARAAYIRGAKITLIAADIKDEIPEYIDVIKVKSAKEMYEEVMKIYRNFDLIIKAAAVSDYTPKKFSASKIKKGNDLYLELIRTKDILLELGKNKKDYKLVGFAAESENILEYAKEKIYKKNLDYIVANNISVAGKEDTSVTIINTQGKSEQISGTKFDVANKILTFIKD